MAEIAVSPRTVPHPTRDEIFTLGECIPLPAVDGAAEGIQSRVVLYHGSFQALARIAPGFDWRAEAWETLTHELRHHLEWRARAPDLEAYDRAAEHNFARQDGEPFDPLFFLDGEPAGSDCYQVDDDVFLDVTVDHVPAERRLLWRGRVYRVADAAGGHAARVSHRRGCRRAAGGRAGAGAAASAEAARPAPATGDSSRRRCGPRRYMFPPTRRRFPNAELPTWSFRS